MPKVNLSEAARLTGKARVTIHRHIDNGKLTKEIDGAGNPVVDVAELERVYGTLKQPDLLQTVTQLQPETASNSNLLQREIDILREERERERSQLCQQIEDLRRDRDHARDERDRLLKVIEEQAGSVRQLTDQRQPKPAAAPSKPEPKPAPPKGWRGFLYRLAGAG
jgi:hypothetical protein